MELKKGRLLLAAAFLICACGPSRPPFTQLDAGSVRADPQLATVIFLWPSTSCDPGGYYTLATADGKFVGNVESGTQLRTLLPPGQYTFFGWNDPREEGQAAIVKGMIPVLSAALTGGRTYYVRMAFGEWDDKGPRNVFTVRKAVRVCFAPDHKVTSAFVSLRPNSDLWDEIPTWTRELEAIAPDAASGQSWLDGRREAFTSHLSFAQSRFDELRAGAKHMATIDAADGVATSP